MCWEGSCDVLYGTLMRSWVLKRASLPLWWMWWCNHWWEFIFSWRESKLLTLECSGTLNLCHWVVIRIFTFFFFLLLLSAHREMLFLSWRKTQTQWRMSLMKKKCSFLRLSAGGDASWTGRSKTLETARLFQVGVTSLLIPFVFEVRGSLVWRLYAKLVCVTDPQSSISPFTLNST